MPSLPSFKSVEFFYNGTIEQASEELKAICKQLQLDDGLLNRVPPTERSIFLYRADRWTDEKLRSFYTTPFQRVLIGVPQADGSTAEILDYPAIVKEIAIYRACYLLVTSEYFENDPNRSDAAETLRNHADKLLLESRTRTPIRVGRGRRKHPNPFIPPSIAPLEMEEKPEI